MPLQELRVTTTAQTDESGAVTATRELENPVIREGLIFIDPASNGEVQAQLRIGDTPIFPGPTSATISVPGRNGPAPINRELPGVPGDVELRAWAPDADFSHEVIAQVEVVSRENVPDSVRIEGVADAMQATARSARVPTESLTDSGEDT